VPVSGITVSDSMGPVVCATSGTASIVSLAPGGSEICSFTYVTQQSDLDGRGGGDDDIDNTASVSGTYAAAPVSASASSAVTLVITPLLVILKDASPAGPVDVGDVITYTYQVTNSGNVTITGVTVADVHNGYGTAPVPSGEVLVSDLGAPGGSADLNTDGSWDTLGPGDVIAFTATYTVEQQDVDLLQ
jgi:large repetitive protein